MFSENFSENVFKNILVINLLFDHRGGKCDRVTGDCAQVSLECSFVTLMIQEVGDCVNCGNLSFVHSVHLHCHTIIFIEQR